MQTLVTGTRSLVVKASALEKPGTWVRVLASVKFSILPLRPFFYAALAKRWKVQFRQGFAYLNNYVDSKRHIIIRTAILYIYMYLFKCFTKYRALDCNK